MKNVTIMALGALFVVLASAGIVFGAHEWGQGQANVNTATKEQLVWFLGQSGVDNQEEIAESIIAYREANGPFSSIDELTNVQGIDEENLEKIRLWVKLEGQTDYEPTKTVPPVRDPFPEEGADTHWK